MQDYIMAEIMLEAGLPPDVFNLVTGTGQEVGAALSSHSQVDMISFTGSIRAGIEIAKAAAPTVKRVTQELGGKSPFIITEQADLAAAVICGVEDVMLNTGQTCSALTRMLVPQSRYQEALALAKAHVETLQCGTNGDAFMGPACSQTQQQQILDYIRIGLKEGASLLCGGTEAPEGVDKGYYVAPTIFSDVNNSMRIAREEIFGPVLCILPYETIEQAIEIANDTPYGLSSGVYAEDEATALEIAGYIRAGLCFINGGYKQSGNGREFSLQGVMEFMETKAIKRPLPTK